MFECFLYDVFELTSEFVSNIRVKSLKKIYWALFFFFFWVYSDLVLSQVLQIYKSKTSLIEESLLGAPGATAPCNFLGA